MESTGFYASVWFCSPKGGQNAIRDVSHAPVASSNSSCSRLTSPTIIVIISIDWFFTPSWSAALPKAQRLTSMLIPPFLLTAKDIKSFTPVRYDQSRECTYSVVIFKLAASWRRTRILWWTSCTFSVSQIIVSMSENSNLAGYVIVRYTVILTSLIPWYPHSASCSSSLFRTIFDVNSMLFQQWQHRL